MIIYRATNKIDGMMYIEQTVQPMENRKRGHKSSAKNESPYYFHRAIRKYGFENFTFEEIDTAKDIETLNDLEEYYIQYFNTLKPNGYNLESGGNNKRLHENTKKKLSEIAKKRPPMSEETRQKVGRKKEKHHLWGIGHTEKSIIKMSESKKGMYDGEKNPFFGKTHTEEVKEVLSKKHSGYRYSPKTEFKKGLIPHNKRQIIDIVNGFVWDSRQEAADAYGVASATIRDWIIGRSPNKYNLRYVDEIYDKEFV